MFVNANDENYHNKGNLIFIIAPVRPVLSFKFISKRNKYGVRPTAYPTFSTMPQPFKSKIQHILISRTDAIGDVVLTLPMAGLYQRSDTGSDRFIFRAHLYPTCNKYLCSS
jgi:hypothetical protein